MSHIQGSQLGEPAIPSHPFLLGLQGPGLTSLGWVLAYFLGAVVPLPGMCLSVPQSPVPDHFLLSSPIPYRILKNKKINIPL